MDGKTIGHKLGALRGEMDAKPLLMRLNQHFGAFMYERGERIPATRSKSALLSISARVSEEIFSQNEHILCAIQKEVKSMKSPILPKRLHRSC